MKCPIDETQLVMSARQGIEIDYCPQCRGVWLDRGELDKIIDRSSETRPSEQPARPDRDRDDRNRDDRHRSDHYRDDRDHRGDSHRGYPRKKKESFLGDLFDF